MTILTPASRTGGTQTTNLRRTAVSRMIASVQLLPIIAKVVEWGLSTVIEIAERYGHFQEDELRRAVEAIF